MMFTHSCCSFDQNNPHCKYGSLPPHMRYSVDQSPLPIMIGLDDTCDTKSSHVPVCVSQTGAGSEKGCCCIKICFRNLRMQPNIVVIFWLKGKMITAFMKQAYVDDVILLLKDKVRSDRRVFLDWANTHLHQIIEYNHNKKDSSKEQLLLL